MKKLLNLFIVSTFFSSFILGFTFYDNYKKQNQVLGDVTVNGNIYGCSLNLRARPERRSSTNTFNSNIKVEIYDRPSQDSVLEKFKIETDREGDSLLDICEEEKIYMVGNDYDFFVRGISTLWKYYFNLEAFEEAHSFLDFSEGDTTFLISGETSKKLDDEINSLDISTQNKKIFQYERVNDLNEDGDINSLDFSNQYFNIFEQGDKYIES